MTFHLAGFYESVDQGNLLQAIAAMSDQAINTSGDNLTVPSDLPFLGGAAVLTAATTLNSAQVQTPSMRSLTYYDVDALTNADDFNQPYNIDEFLMNPKRLVATEDMQFHTSTDNTGAVGILGLVWLCDGPVTKVEGEQFTVRCTASATLTFGSWVNSNLTFTQDLPAGTYDVVGMRAVGTNLQAARLVFIGGVYRPGVPGSVSTSGTDPDTFRFGNRGIFGSFNQNALPSIDCLGTVDTSQEIFLDLIKTS